MIKFDSFVNTKTGIGEIKQERFLKLRHITKPEHIKNILTNGFSLKYFGKTGKEDGFPNELVKHDPVGIYAFLNDKESEDQFSESFVDFSLFGINVLYTNGTAITAKKVIWDALKGKSSADVAKKLLKMGIDVVATDVEYIVLNVDKIIITSHS